MPEQHGFIKLVGGQITDLSAIESPANAFTVLQNIIPTAEGLKPVHVLLDAIGPKIQNVALNTIGFPVYLQQDIGYIVTNNGDSYGLYSVNSFIGDSHNLTITPTVLSSSTLGTVWSSLSNEKQLAGLLRLIPFVYGDYIVYMDNLTYTAGNINNKQLYKLWNQKTSTGSNMLDTDGSIQGLAPQPEKFIVDNEYLIAIGGFDSFTFNITSLTVAAITGATVLTVGLTPNIVNGDFISIELNTGSWHNTTIVSFVTNTSITIAVGLPSAAASGNNVHYNSTSQTEQASRVRWNHPASINQWLPSSKLPPSNLAGYKELSSIAPFIDSFVFNFNVYVVTGDNLYVLSRVGGTTGYIMKALNIRMKLAFGAINSCVALSTGVYILTVEGLYLFNGQVLTPISSGQTEEFFTKQWFRDHIEDSLFSEASAIQSVQYGMHVPNLDCIMWFVTYGTGTNAKHMILVYNYEINAGSYLLPPANEIWHPVLGQHIGLAVYDKTTGLERCFIFRAKETASTPPDANVIIESGYMGSDPKENKSITINRLLFNTNPKLPLDIFSGMTLTVSGYIQEDIVHETKTIGLFELCYNRGYFDTRIGGRYIRFRIEGSPNSWTAWTQVIKQQLAVIKSFMFYYITRGRRL